MNSSLLEKYVTEVLKNHGWYLGRRFDAESWITELTKEGYSCFEYAIDILQDLGDIEVNIFYENIWGSRISIRGTQNKRKS